MEKGCGFGRLRVRLKIEIHSRIFLSYLAFWLDIVLGAGYLLVWFED